MSEDNPPSTVGFDATTDTTHITFNWDDDGSVCEVIVNSIAAVTGQRPETLEPLYETINPDALESLFRPVSPKAPRNTGSVTFTYERCEITVHAVGTIEIDTSHIELDST